MARKRDDAALAVTPPTDQQVLEFLGRNPDFLLRHPEALLSLSPPSRFKGTDGLVDMQVYMIERLRDELDRVRGAADHLINTSRSNMSTQTRTHEAALLLLAAETMDALAEVVTDDLTGLLAVDVATLRFEKPTKPLPKLAVPGVQLIPTGMVEKILGGRDRDYALTEQMPGDPLMFDEAATLVLSSAVVRLSPGGRCPDGLLALGSRHPRTFHAGQGTELLTFLARITETCVRRLVG